MADYCAFIKADGTPCRARPLTGDHCCISHSKDPRAIQTKAKAVRKGGLIKARPDLISSWTPSPIDTLEDLKKGLSELFAAGMKGEVSTARLSALAAVANSLGKVIEGSDLEKRIKALEDSQEVLRVKP